MLNRTLPPVYHTVSGFELIPPRRVTFSNGIPVYVFDGGEQDAVRVEWIFGNNMVQRAQALTSMCAAQLLLEGTSTYNSAQLAERIDFHGAFLVPEYGYDQSSLTLFSLNRHLMHLLPLVKAVLTDAVFPEKELATYIRNSQQKLQVSLKKNGFMARRLFNRAVFGDSQYGFVPELADYASVTRAGLLDVFPRQYAASNCTLVVSGKVTDEALASLAHLFGDTWETQGERSGGVLPEIADPGAQWVVDERADALQSAIRLGCQSIQRNHPDFAGLQVLNTLFGGYFGSRLMANIREDKGYTYSIGSGLVSLQRGAFFTISSEVGVDKTAATLAEIEYEMRRLRNEPVGEAELALVRNYLMGSMLGSLEHVFSHADKFKNVHFSGLGLDYYDEYAKTVNSITPDEIMRLANTYLDYDKMTKVIVGKVG